MLIHTFIKWRLCSRSLGSVCCALALSMTTKKKTNNCRVVDKKMCLVLSLVSRKRCDFPKWLRNRNICFKENSHKRKIVARSQPSSHIKIHLCPKTIINLDRGLIHRVLKQHAWNPYLLHINQSFGEKHSQISQTICGFFIIYLNTK